MNKQKKLNFHQKLLCPIFTQLLIKFSHMNFLRAEIITQEVTYFQIFDSDRSPHQ